MIESGKNRKLVPNKQIDWRSNSTPSNNNKKAMDHMTLPLNSTKPSKKNYDQHFLNSSKK